MRVLLLSFITIASAFASETPLGILGGAETILKEIKATSGCSTLATAAICRQLPWIPQSHEGVWKVGNFAVVIYEMPKEGSAHPLASVALKIQPEHAHLHTSLHIVGSNSVMRAMEVAPFSGIALMAVEKGGEGLKPLSIFIIYSPALINFEATSNKALRADLASALQNWIPPVDLQIPGEFVKF